ncbi:MAG TPA: hypothetical protein VN222_09725 [Novosphingobium sp.]|nr:hypothetical protein [Novosphingobium sp.]
MKQSTRVRKGDAERILAAARNAGFSPRRIRVHDGGFDIIFDDEGQADSPSPNPWDAGAWNEPARR